MSEKWACKFLNQIVEGLKYLRDRNVVHRDLKPHNILLSRKGKTKVLKIADFGFAKIVGSEALADTMCGSPLYMAPEVLKGEEYNNKADLWSVGVILYEMLCGERPFKDVRSIVRLQKKMDQEPIMFPRRVRISRECRELLQSLLVKDPKKRIDWNDLFSHNWLLTDWENKFEGSFLEKSNIPKSSAPISIQNKGFSIKRGIVNNYMRMGSAPLPIVRSPPTRSPPSTTSFSITPNNGSSVFIPGTPGRGLGTTPKFSSDIGQFMKSVESFDEISTMSTSRSFKKIASDVFYTSYGLLKDSLY